MQEHFFMMCLSQLLLIPSRTQVGRCSVLLLYQCLLSNIHSFSVEWRRRVSWWWFNCTMLCSRTVLAVSVQCFWGQRSIMVRGGWSFLLLGGIIIYSLSKQSPPHIMWLENYMRSWSMLIFGASIFFSNWVPYKPDSSSISSLAMHVVERFMVSKS